ncbi:MAG: chemotaxis response regulator protein-glutamate methylesterase [Planctomycetes bacterium]|nr:chemotaxis response regulator protein-glutamate methylesterase [Planctomycetota bacterium]
MIRVLIVDDSPTVRRLLSETLSRADDIEVVGTAPDPYVARERIVELRPDVITLDIEMPRMDGLTFLARLMEHLPIPVVVLSSLTVRGSEQAVRALELGAVEVLCKPASAHSVQDLGEELLRSVRAAAAARPRVIKVPAGPATPPSGVRVKPPPVPLSASRRSGFAASQVLAIGASTGGTEAIRALLERMPADSPATVIVQHLPPMFTASFARRLNEICALRVAEASGGEDLRPGYAYVAPGGRHLLVVRNGDRLRLLLDDGPAEHFQRPAVDVLFRSVAAAAGRSAVGVLLTGMGHDGAAGLLAMRSAGAHTIAQDEATCVVHGMPKAAVACGGAERELPLPCIADAVQTLFQGMR